MLIKPIIHSTTKSRNGFFWFESTFNEIYKTVTRAKGLTIEPFRVEPWKPTKNIPVRIDLDGDKVINWDWFQKEFKDKSKDRFNCVIFHTTSYWRKKWGLSSHIRGTYRTDKDPYIEIYVCADSEREFWRIVCHELGHFCERTLNNNFNIETEGCGKLYNSQVHKADYCDKDLPGLFATFDFNKYDQLKKRIFLRQLTVLMKKLKEIMGWNLIYPVDKEKFLYGVSQRFGVPQTQRRSGIHNGLDIVLPFGSPIKAWCNLEVIKIYKNHNSMGNAAYVKFTHKNKVYYARLLHLMSAPLIGKYKQGQTLCFSGSTGDSTGPHLHIEIWRVPIDVKILLSEKTVRANLLDPYKFFLYEIDGIIV